MSKRKQGLGLLGLVIVALGVMAFASVAQAVVPRFLVGGTLASVDTVEGEQEGVGTLSIPALNTEINCIAVKVESGKTLSSLEGDATLLYEGCTVLEFKAPLAELPCTVIDTHKLSPVAHVSVLSTLIKPIEFSDKTFGILASTAGVFVNFKSGTGCPLPLKTEIKGTVCAKITTATNNTKEPLAQFSETIQKAAGCGDKFLYGVNESFVTANAKLWVAGKGSTLGVALD